MTESRDFMLIINGGDIYYLTRWLLGVLDAIDDPAIYDSKTQQNYGWNIYPKKHNRHLYFMIHLNWIDGDPIPKLHNDLLTSSISIHKLDYPCHVDVYSISTELMRSAIKELVEPYVSTKWVKWIQGEWFNVVCSSNIIS